MNADRIKAQLPQIAWTLCRQLIETIDKAQKEGKPIVLAPVHHTFSTEDGPEFTVTLYISEGDITNEVAE